MKITNLNDLFTLKLKALYDIETQILKALPKMIKKTTDEKLQQAFSDHLNETKGHVERLENIFELLDMKPTKTKVEAIRGLVMDTEWIIKEKPDKPALDALLIASAEYVEHYEIAGYESLRDWALLLGNDDVVKLIESTLEEEKGAAMRLNMLANDGINERTLALKQM